jgi:hypothetical protein
MPQSRMEIASFDELLENETRLVEMINATPKGGNLFMANPLLLLRDLGVELSGEASEQLKEREPNIFELTDSAYRAIQASDEQQRVRYRLKGLFRHVATPREERS